MGRRAASRGGQNTLLGRYFQWRKRRALNNGSISNSRVANKGGSCWLLLVARHLLLRFFLFVKRLRRWQLVHFVLWGGSILCLYTLLRWYCSISRKPCITHREVTRPTLLHMPAPLPSFLTLIHTTKDETIVDVCIVGAGPSGATCAYHLAKGGLRQLPSLTRAQTVCAYRCKQRGDHR